MKTKLDLYQLNQSLTRWRRERDSDSRGALRFAKLQILVAPPAIIATDPVNHCTLLHAGKRRDIDWERVHGELTGSSGYRSLVQASTVPPPFIRTEPSWRQLLLQAVPAGALPAAPHAFDGRYSNVENRLASPPDRLWSKIRCGREARGELC